MRNAKDRGRSSAPARRAGSRKDTPAPPRALMGQPNPEQNPQELHRDRPWNSVELMAIGYGYAVKPRLAAPSARSLPAYIGGVGGGQVLRPPLARPRRGAGGLRAARP